MVGLLSAGLVVAMLPGIATAAPNPDSVAGICGLCDDTNPGIGDSIGDGAIVYYKSEAEAGETTLGELLHYGFELDGVAFTLVEPCTPSR
jgi:hypothetical protein